MKFSDYMNAWLYGEEGYYTHFETIGKEGDFYTAVSTSKYFGGAIAKYMISRIEGGYLPADLTLCEIGGHQGYLMADMIEFIYTLKPDLLKTISFVMVERKEDVQKAQLKYFEESFGDVITLQHVKSLDELAVESAFFVANEIFDAFSCEIVKDGKTAVVNEHEVLFEGEESYALEVAKKYGFDKGEVSLGFEAFAESMFGAAKKSEFVTFDYGDLHPRNDISTRIYKGHEVFPLFDEEITLSELYANSDITYDVNFQHLKDVYESLGFSTVAFSTQLKALMEFGIMELLQMVLDHAGFEAYTLEAGKIKTLIDPSMMGERFKMIHFKKGV